MARPVVKVDCLNHGTMNFTTKIEGWRKDLKKDQKKLASIEWTNHYKGHIAKIIRQACNIPNDLE